MTSKSLPDKHLTLWTVKDLSFLENNYGTMSVAELATILKGTPGAVGLMADRLGCRGKKSLPWSEAEMEIIRHHYS
ncbi:hypothetical protein [Enterobacter ludwigii]